jgi:hypothetical protein
MFDNRRRIKRLTGRSKRLGRSSKLGPIGDGQTARRHFCFGQEVSVNALMNTTMGLVRCGDHLRMVPLPFAYMGGIRSV